MNIDNFNDLERLINLAAKSELACIRVGDIVIQFQPQYRNEQLDLDAVLPQELHNSEEEGLEEEKLYWSSS